MLLLAAVHTISIWKKERTISVHGKSHSFVVIVLEQQQPRNTTCWHFPGHFAGCSSKRNINFRELLIKSRINKHLHAIPHIENQRGYTFCKERCFAAAAAAARDDRMGVRDHFMGGGGTHFFARISHLCPKVEYIWAMHFCRTWGGAGGGGTRATLLEVIGNRTPHRGRAWERVSHSDGRGLFGNVGTKPGMGCIIKFKLYPQYFSSQCIRLQYKGGGKPFMLLSNVLDTKGGGGYGPVRGSIRLHSGDFGEIWVPKPG